MNETQNASDIYDRCLELVSKNKLNSSNAWDLTFIDHLEEFNDESAQFSRIAATVDTATYIYSKKVDSLHESSFRFAGTLIAPNNDQSKTINESFRQPRKSARKATSSILPPEKHKSITLSSVDLSLNRMKNDPIMPFVFKSVISDVPDLLLLKAHFSPDGYPIILPDIKLEALPVIHPIKMHYRAPMLPEEMSIGFKLFKAALNNEEIPVHAEIREEVMSGDVEKFIEEGVDEMIELGDAFAELDFDANEGLDNDEIAFIEDPDADTDQLSDVKRMAYLAVKPLLAAKNKPKTKPKAPKVLLDFTQIAISPQPTKISSFLSQNSINRFAQIRKAQVLSLHPDINLEELFRPPTKLFSPSNDFLEEEISPQSPLDIPYDEGLDNDNIEDQFLGSPVSKLRPSFYDSDLPLFKPVSIRQQTVGDGIKVAINRTMVNMPRLKSSVEDVIKKENPQNLAEVISKLPEHHEFNDLKSITVPYAIIALLHLASEGGCDIDSKSLKIIPK